MRILLVYATNSSGTEAVSQIVASVLRSTGHRVTVKRANEPGIRTLGGYQLVILGSCTWVRTEGHHELEGQLQEHMYALTQRLMKKPLPGQPFALFALGDSSYTNFCAAADHLEEFVRTVDGHTILPTLRIDSYFFDLNPNRDRAERWAKKVSTAISKKIN